MNNISRLELLHELANTWDSNTLLYRNHELVFRYAGGAGAATVDVAGFANMRMEIGESVGERLQLIRDVDLLIDIIDEG